MTLDPALSVLAILLVGWLGTLVALATRLPRIVPVILLGVALAPALHNSVLKACGDAASAGSGGAVSAASELRTFALLVALARGGLTMNIGNAQALKVPVALLSLLPYAAELGAQYVVSRAALPDASGLSAATASPALTLLAASVWAPLSPSIVLPNMLAFLELGGMSAAAGFVMTGAPIEIGTAIITFSSLESFIKTSVAGGSSPSEAFAWLPVQVLGSLAWGALFAGLFWLLVVKVRPHPAVKRLLGGAEQGTHETLLVFLALFCVTYAICTDYYVPRLVGLLAALSMALVTQLVLPVLAKELALALKPVWLYAEAFLFVLTGVVVRAAIDSNSPALGGPFLAVLLVGSLARMLADLVVAFAWQHSVARARGRADTPRETLLMVLRRAAFLWSATTPKATLQASLGPRPATETVALGISAVTGAFIAQSCAVAILYMALFGSVLTYSVGKTMALFLEAYDVGAVETAGDEGEGGEGGESNAPKELLLAGLTTVN